MQTIGPLVPCGATPQDMFPVMIELVNPLVGVTLTL
jgi:hypothetical protein